MTLLTTTGTVATYRGKDATGDEMLRVQQLVESVSEAIEQHTDRRFTSTAVTVERHGGNETPFLILENEPVISVEEIREAETVVDSADYLVNSNGVIELVSRTWSKTRNAIEVDYTHGYATVPKDIERAATTQVAYEHLLTGRENRLGDKRTVFEEGGTNQYITDAFYPGVLEIIERYRRVS